MKKRKEYIQTQVAQNSLPDVQMMRNVGISAHVDSGKTTLTERMLFYAGRIHRIREVRGGDGGATMDSHPIEERRGITIKSAATRIEWNDHAINIIDTPGHVDFTVEVERSLRVLDSAVLVLCASRGVQSQSVTVDRQMNRYRIPRIAFINKMDRVGADFDRVVEQMRQRIDANPVAIQIPMGAAEQFAGIVDLVTMEAVTFGGEHGVQVQTDMIPASWLEPARTARARMLEQLAMQDDALMSCLLENERPAESLIKSAIRRATLSRRITPVLAGSAFKDKGVQRLLDAIVDYLPSPAETTVEAQVCDRAGDSLESPTIATLACDASRPLVAMAFKTSVEAVGVLTYLRIYQGVIHQGSSYRNVRTGKSIRVGKLVRMHADQREDLPFAQAGDIVGVIGIDGYSGDTFTDDKIDWQLESFQVADPVVSLAIAPSNRCDADKLALALDRFRKEDPTFRVLTDADSGETLIAGMGQLHLQVYIERIAEEYDCDCLVGSPSVTYQERPSRSVPFAHQFKKQTGGPGQFAKVVGQMTPIDFDEAEAFSFVDKITGGRVEPRYISAVRQGFQESLESGPLGGYPVVGIEIELTDGDQHDNDSSEVAFKNCARQAMQEAILPQASLALWEPVVKLEIECPADHQGAVTSQLARKRGVIRGSTTTENLCQIEAEAPLAELFDYSNELRSITQGNGLFTMEPHGYQQVPARIQKEVLK